jgi:lipopolysaccharide export system protein LptA
MNNNKSFTKKILILFAISFIQINLFSENISFSANSMKGTVGNNSDTTELIGDAFVLTETMEISANSIKMSGKDFRYIEAQGSVKGKNLQSKMEFSCDKLKYDRETKIAELKDNVSLTDTQNDVSAKAQMIEYNQDSEIAIMQIDVELKQKDNTCTGAYAIYRKTDKMLELSGNAQIKQKSDTFRAQEISLNMDTQEISLDGRVKGSITDERKTEDTVVEEENSSTEAKTEKATKNKTSETSAPSSEEKNTDTTTKTEETSSASKEKTKAEDKSKKNKNKSKSTTEIVDNTKSSN